MASRTDRFKLIPAVYLFLRRGNEVLLLRRANTGYQDGNYGLISGHLEGNELSTHAIVREAREEAGIELDPTDLKFVHVSHRLSRNEPGQERVDLFYDTNKWRGEPRIMEPDKCSDMGWYPFDQLPANIIPIVALVLKDVGNKIPYSEYLTEPV